MIIECIVQPRTNRRGSPVALLTEDFIQGCTNVGTSLWPCKAVMVVRHVSVAAIFSLNEQRIPRNLRLPLTTAGPRVTQSVVLHPPRSQNSDPDVHLVASNLMSMLHARRRLIFQPSRTNPTDSRPPSSTRTISPS
jgi:hypothetical protein